MSTVQGQGTCPQLGSPLLEARAVLDADPVDVDVDDDVLTSVDVVGGSLVAGSRVVVEVDVELPGAWVVDELPSRTGTQDPAAATGAWTSKR